MSTLCPLCESRDGRPAFEKKDYAHYECLGCRALYVSPRPTANEIAQFYRRKGAESLSSVCWSEDSDSHRHWQDTWRRLLSEVERRSGRGPLLDLGCGTGQFLAFAHEQGWRELTGVELVPEAAAIAQKRVGAEIHVSDLTETSLEGEHFAVVFLWDIIEHIGDVGAFLREVHRLLRPGGLAVIGTVNRHGVSLRVLRERALTVSPPEHLTFFTRAGLSEAVAAAGLELTRCWSATIYLREWTRRADIDHYTEWRSRLTGGSLFRCAMTIANLALRLTNLGDELIAIARKRGGLPTD